MKKLIIAMLVLLGLPDLILAEKVVPDRQLLIDAEQQANVFHADAGPFQLDVDFVVYVQVPAAVRTRHQVPTYVVPMRRLGEDF